MVGTTNRSIDAMPSAIIAEGFADPARRPDSGPRGPGANLGRTTSPICSSLSFDKDSSRFAEHTKRSVAAKHYITPASRLSPQLFLDRVKQNALAPYLAPLYDVLPSPRTREDTAYSGPSLRRYRRAKRV